MKKVITLFGVSIIFLLVLGGCGRSGDQELRGPINVVSREDGSGTRGAFIELFGVEEKDADGDKVDHTKDRAEITNSTSVVMLTVQGDPTAIGYISLGSMNDMVKALSIDGVSPSAEAIKDGSYGVSRPFNIATKGEVNPPAQDFINFILSKEGQAIVAASGYIPVESTESYTSSVTTGKVVVAGSSSVTPVMEALKEAYVAINSGVKIEVQQNDSTTGMNAAIEGICDIGMASRALKDSEREKGLDVTTIALDGIVVIVNKENPVNNLTKEQVKSIFVGELKNWSELS